MYLDAIQFKVRDNGHVRNKAIYLAIGVTIEGYKEVLGLWIYLALRNIAKKWTMPVHAWKDALNRFAIIYEDRLPAS